MADDVVWHRFNGTVTESAKVVRDSVAILCPCAGPVPVETFQSGMVVSSIASAKGYPVRVVGVTHRTVIHTARNWLAEGFLQTECEWAFWMDSDMTFPPDVIPKMIGWLKKIGGKFATGIYFQRGGSHKPLIMIRDARDHNNNPVTKYDDDYTMTCIVPNEHITAPFKCDGAGFGCIITHRDIFSEVPKPWFKNHWFTEDKETSEDFWFCRQARKAGVDLWVIPEIECGHIGDPVIITRKDFKRPENVQPTTIKLETVRAV